MSSIVKTIPLMAGTGRTTTSTSFTPIVERIPIELDLSYYDGTISVYLEVVFQTSNGAGVATVELYDNDAAIQLTSVVTSQTSATRVRSANIAGSIVNNNELIIRFKSSSGSYTTTIYSAILVIKQTGAITKTETWIPVNCEDITRTSDSFGTSTSRGLWYYNAAYWDGITSVDFYAIFWANVAGYNAYVRVYNTGSDYISASELSSSSTTPYVVRKSSDIKSYLVSGDTYTFRSKTDLGGEVAVYGCFIRVRQSNFTKTECHLYLLDDLTSTTSESYVDSYGRFLWDSNDWIVGSSTILFAIAAYTSNAAYAASFDLRHGATTDVTLTTNATSYTILSNTFNPVDDTEYSFYLKIGNSAATARSTSKAILVRITNLGSSSSSSSRSSSSSSSSRSSSSSSSRSSSSSSSSSKSSSSSSSMTPGWTWGEEDPVSIIDLGTSYSLTRDNTRLSLIDGTAFAWLNGVDLGLYVGKYLVIEDSLGNKAKGWIKAASSGMTLGSEQVVNGNMESDSDWDTGGLETSERSSVRAYSGTYSWHGVDSVANNGGFYQIGVFLDDKDKLFQLDFWYYIESGGIVSFTNGGYDIGWYDQYYNTGEWTRVTKYFTEEDDLSHYVSFSNVSATVAAEYYIDDVSVKQVTAPPVTGVTIVSVQGGSVYNWASIDSNFNSNDRDGYTYSIYSPPVISNSLTRDNTRLSLVSNNAFAWLNGVDLSQYIGKYLVIIDSNNKSVQGWIKAAGSGETLGSQQAPMSCCTDPDDDQNTIGEGYAGWLPYNSAMLTSELGGVTGRCLKVLENGGADPWANHSHEVTIGGLYKFTFSVKKGTALYYRAYNYFSAPVGQGLPSTDYYEAPANWTETITYMTAPTPQSSGIINVVLLTVATVGAGTYHLFDNISFKQVTAPPTTGTTIVSQKGGNQYNWAYKDSNFDYNDENGYTYYIFDSAQWKNAEVWSYWTFKGTLTTARNTGDYGKIQLYTGEEIVSPVKDTGSTNIKFLRISFDDYDVGYGSFSIQWRGRSTIFAQDSNELLGPVWEEYIPGGANKAWRYVQIKITGL